MNTLTPTDYIAAFKARESCDTTGLYGRVHRGRSKAALKRLHPDDWRKIVFVMGSEGLEQLVGASRQQICDILGYDEEYMRIEMQKGLHFQLSVFNKPEPIMRSATWQNLTEYCAELYPEVADVFLSVKHEVANISVQDLKDAGIDIPGIIQLNDEHPEFMSTKRLLTIEQPTAKDVRLAEFCLAGARGLFSGDGYTYDEAGNRGVPEYLLKNQSVANLDASTIDLSHMFKSEAFDS